MATEWLPTSDVRVNPKSTLLLCFRRFPVLEPEAHTEVVYRAERCGYISSKNCGLFSKTSVLLLLSYLGNGKLFWWALYWQYTRRNLRAYPSIVFLLFGQILQHSG
ncbi:hypothetical protein XENTR_v10016708 [Xenopus tropicalis]|nr:hypothetical protein XENTR_v10016708 [Xenopus tropicalis]KAE8598065.1 hypothetical protein XENTR_v10016708 [Xenopus tropicalis]